MENVENELTDVIYVVTPVFMDSIGLLVLSVVEITNELVVAVVLGFTSPEKSKKKGVPVVV